MARLETDVATSTVRTSTRDANAKERVDKLFGREGQWCRSSSARLVHEDPRSFWWRGRKNELDFKRRGCLFFFLGGTHAPRCGWLSSPCALMRGPDATHVEHIQQRGRRLKLRTALLRVSAESLVVAPPWPASSPGRGSPAEAWPCGAA